MKIKTSELTGAALDWAVAKCEDFSVRWGFDDDCPEYSSNWAQGGTIIEREGISLYLDTNNLWQANIFDGNPAVFGAGIEGSTPLIAAMRCYVASVFGDEIEIPDELMEAV